MSFAIPTGFYWKIIGRSGLANVHDLVTFNGTVDADYRGTLCVLSFNLSDNEYIVEIGNQILQLIIEKCCNVKFVEYNELPDTKRSVEGFGSSLGFYKTCIHLIAEHVLEKVSMQLKLQLTCTTVFWTH